MLRSLLCCTIVWLAGFVPAQASYHLTEIQQVIGGVGGDVRAQAIQIRMRQPGQELLHQARIRAWDAQGNNAVLIIQFPSDVSNTSLGEATLIASSEFLAFTEPATQADFLMTNLIPASYLEAGSLTFEDLASGTVLWRLSWGGSKYTGSNSGSLVNDADGNFGPAFSGSLPSDGLLSLMITRAVTGASTNSATDYALTGAAATFTNNSRLAFTLVDRCPDDPNKVAAGTCGCGVADSDRDGDGQADCVDACPDDSSNTCNGAPVRPSTGLCGAATFEVALFSAMMLLCIRPLRRASR